jgi:hypothetical protein
MQQLKTILFTNARDEKNMYEWVAHHLLLGFDFIYIFDHKSIVPLTGQFAKFNKDFQKVFVYRSEENGPVKFKFIEFAAKISKSLNVDWFLYLDADEFLVINSDKVTSVKEFLSYYNYADSISINWLLFGSNYHVDQPFGLLIDNFTRSDDKLDEHLKTFLRPSAFLNPNPHRSDIKNPNKAYHANGINLNKVVPVYKCNKHYINPIKFNETKVFIAHYIFQSEEIYKNRKLKIPRDDNFEYREDNINIHLMHNAVVNTIVKDKYSEKIKEYLKSIDIIQE